MTLQEALDTMRGKSLPAYGAAVLERWRIETAVLEAEKAIRADTAKARAVLLRIVNRIFGDLKPRVRVEVGHEFLIDHSKSPPVSYPWVHVKLYARHPNAKALMEVELYNPATETIVVDALTRLHAAAVEFLKGA